jgi:hypothetical protein
MNQFQEAVLGTIQIIRDTLGEGEGHQILMKPIPKVSRVLVDKL